VTVHLVKLIVFSFCSVLFLYLYGEIVEYICTPLRRYSITERRVPEQTPVLGSQPAGDVES